MGFLHNSAGLSPGYPPCLGSKGSEFREADTLVDQSDSPMLSLRFLFLGDSFAGHSYLSASDFDLVDPWSDLLGEWLQRHGTAAYVSRDQIYSFLDIAPERQNNYNAQRIRELMANHGWKYD